MSPPRGNMTVPADEGRGAANPNRPHESTTLTATALCPLWSRAAEWARRRRMIREARRFLYLSTYYIEYDDYGAELIALLLAAQRRGVAVNLLIDGFGQRLGGVLMSSRGQGASAGAARRAARGRRPRDRVPSSSRDAATPRRRPARQDPGLGAGRSDLRQQQRHADLVRGLERVLRRPSRPRRARPARELSGHRRRGRPRPPCATSDGAPRERGETSTSTTGYATPTSTRAAAAPSGGAARTG